MTRIKQPHRRMTRWLGGALPVVVAALVAPPIASASASLNGTDPYRSGCARGATVAGYGLITDNIHPPLGRIYLMWSPRCQRTGASRTSTTATRRPIQSLTSPCGARTLASPTLHHRRDQVRIPPTSTTCTRNISTPGWALRCGGIRYSRLAAPGQ